MNQQIFFEIFDGPQNIFLCSIFLILFFKSSGTLSTHKTNSGKNKEKCLMHFDLDARVFVLSN